jgi:hypothetical protein
MAKTTNKLEKEDKFTKDAILGAKSFAASKDALEVILEDDKTYTLKEVSTLLADFMKGKVK